MPQFHTVEVTKVCKTIRDAVVLTLSPSDATADFSFIPGQYLTFKRDFDGVELRRSYSICAGQDEGVLRVGIKRIEGGSFSNWANETLKVGDSLEVMPPMGEFHMPAASQLKKRFLVFAGGSGITPILSILKSTLEQNPNAHFTLLYANKSVTSVMFREELEDLKNSFMDRFNIIHILEESAEASVFSGRIDEEKLTKMFNGLIDIRNIDKAYICGPKPMMLKITKSLQDHGMSNDQIMYELFAGDQPGLAKVRPAVLLNVAGGTPANVHITIDGTTRAVSIEKGTKTILEAAIENDIGAPYSCRAGVCATCKAKVKKGEVEMVANHALEDYEVEQGYVLTCQCYPISDEVLVDYDG